MKAIVNTNLNERTELPSVNAPIHKYYKAGDEVNIVEIVNGDPYEGNKVWYKLDNGRYVWSGGVEGVTNISASESKINREVKLQIPDNSLDWWHHKLHIPELWKNLNTMGEGVNIAVFDSGLLLDTNSFNYSNITGVNLVDSNESYNDVDGHGTEVTSLLAATHNDLLGICPYSNIKIIKFSSKKSNSYSADFVRLLEGLKVHLEGIDIAIISYSFFIEDFSEELINEFIKVLNEKGQETFIFCSNGDDVGSYAKLPCDSTAVLRIAASNSKNSIYEASNVANNILLTAPGVSVKTLGLDNKIKRNTTGSSYAVPVSAGVFSLILSFIKNKDININHSMLINLFKNCADSKLPANKYGNGIINPKRFFELVKKEFQL